ncbi:MAG TPA: preprotein translocase subunit SecG [Saprospiraceae bacterium]|nr:preprotein translocase subunit SecG [Saprospiraceae bacterium]HPG06442.1 preprotein translocase subunit SecG [Saprospiraceae bacterium]HPR01755.1 preprotein translocase subunit SecG [Saprospiraceae bacterium]HRV84030.1 preprotein translocase subunit SecG [Saprospiraceae bacterium]
MLGFITVFTAFVCVLLMLVVLIQNPKGGGIDSTFGGSSANQMFGAAKSTDFIEKLTWGLAAALFILCIISAIMVGGGAVPATPAG